MHSSTVVSSEELFRSIILTSSYLTLTHVTAVHPMKKCAREMEIFSEIFHKGKTT